VLALVVCAFAAVGNDSLTAISEWIAEVPGWLAPGVLPTLEDYLARVSAVA
jgi:hypothetical protein